MIRRLLPALLLVACGHGKTAGRLGVAAGIAEFSAGRDRDEPIEWVGDLAPAAMVESGVEAGVLGADLRLGIARDLEYRLRPGFLARQERFGLRGGYELFGRRFDDGLHSFSGLWLEVEVPFQWVPFFGRSIRQRCGERFDERSCGTMLVVSQAFLVEDDIEVVESLRGPGGAWVEPWVETCFGGRQGGQQLRIYLDGCFLRPSPTDFDYSPPTWLSARGGILFSWGRREPWNPSR